VEAARRGGFSFVAYRAEPASWWRDSEGEWIKPDAFLVVERDDIQDAWVVEVDQSTESLPTLRRKLLVYVELVANGEHGPDGDSLPRVLVTVPDERRSASVRGLVQALPEPAEELFAVTTHERAVAHIGEVLRS
jgi:hypothetical protein